MYHCNEVVFFVETNSTPCGQKFYYIAVYILGGVN